MVKDERILALDISSTCTGWAYGVDGKLIAYGKHIQKQMDRGKKLALFAQWIVQILEAKRPNIILIEKPYRGRNSNVLAVLSKFIAVAEMCVFIVLGIELEDNWFRDPKANKKALQVSKGSDYEDNKRLMVQKINQIYNLKLKYGAKKSKKTNDDDISDAIAILTAWWETENA